ncbi:prepilin-type N-terminal cleavage/methylation domain-containing protein [Vibrio brasiliensis]|jgi:type IV pilus assembly protein PilA/prepilin peptidase dependent protein D|uniref:pilin n=1 Tax=Vibrio brasiliensis TaxID=170652 RepID=UPI001EFCEF9D|nr:prepilin-type N-terminal cleavage/methylation domain-containing protein [Vibrio brasiliensis]MCG9749707.1 prepilin-type N-terminal cleavage/methylation domain-containing protein [Vibrio brasiliensis]MCG9784496.1 prepilin-type N-terminal cleavage/methylation domain-containing protein [Vibrio brasiliensis]
MQTKRTVTGFTLIELMVVVAIVAILATLAIPSYQNYTTRAHASEMLNASMAMKTAVSICLIRGEPDCSSGNGDVPLAQDLGSFSVEALLDATSGDLLIRAEINPNQNKGTFQEGDKVELIPVTAGGGVTWNVVCTKVSSQGGSTDDWCPDS